MNITEPLATSAQMDCTSNSSDKSGIIKKKGIFLGF